MLSRMRQSARDRQNGVWTGPTAAMMPTESLEMQGVPHEPAMWTSRGAGLPHHPRQTTCQNRLRAPHAASRDVPAPYDPCAETLTLRKLQPPWHARVTKGAASHHLAALIMTVPHVQRCKRTTCTCSGSSRAAGGTSTGSSTLINCAPSWATLYCRAAERPVRQGADSAHPARLSMPPPVPGT